MLEYKIQPVYSPRSTLSNSCEFNIFLELSFPCFLRKTRRHRALKCDPGACAIGNSIRIRFLVKKAYDVPVDFSKHIEFQKVEFSKCIALEVPFTKLLKLRNFENSSFLTFEGIFVDTLLSSVLLGHLQM